MHKLDAQVRGVEIPREIEQVHLQHRAPARRDGGPNAEARDGRARGGPDAVYLRRVDAGERRAIVLQLHVGRCESQLASELSSMDHAPADAVGPREQRLGHREVARGEGGAHGRARDPRAGVHHRRHGFDLVSVKGAQFFQQSEIADAFRSETKVLADQEPARPELFREHLLDERFGRKRRERAAETLNVHAFHPARREQLELFAQRGQARGRRLRREELARMRLEREHAARQAALARPSAEAL